MTGSSDEFAARITVMHDVSVWLPLTQNWIYHQVRCLPANVEAHVACHDTQNLAWFPVERLHAHQADPAWRRFLDKLARRAHLPGYRAHLARQLALHKPQVLHSHFGNVGWASMGAARRAGVRHVVTFYGYDMSLLPREDARWRERYRHMFAHVDRVLCEGPHMADRIADLGCPREKLRVHRLGVDVKAIRFEARRWSPGEPFRILIAATFQEKKGIPCALEAIAKLRQKTSLDLRVTLIGDAHEEARSQIEKKRILSVIEREALGGQVDLLGYQSAHRLREEAYKHHVFLSPSLTASDGDSEGGAPVALIEMAATGMPIVSTTHADIPQIITHGVSGLLSEPRDAEGVAAHLAQLVSAPESWEAMARAARSHVESRFDASQQGGHLAGIYAEMIAHG